MTILRMLSSAFSSLRFAMKSGIPATLFLIALLSWAAPLHAQGTGDYAEQGGDAREFECPEEEDDEDEDEEYRGILYDLRRGCSLLETAERAHDNKGDYHHDFHAADYGHPLPFVRDGGEESEEEESSHDAAHEAFVAREEYHPRYHPWDEPHDNAVEDHEHWLDDVEDALDEDLSAYEAVWLIWHHAVELEAVSDRDARDVLKVVVAVVDAWTQCDDTFGAVKRGVEMVPDRAAEIAAAVAIKKDCNCAAGGTWPAERVEGRIRPDIRPTFIEVPRSCSCSQAAMYAAVTGLPENGIWYEADREDEPTLAVISRDMVEKTNEIIERVNAAQSFRGWDCSCSDVNLAASMRGIEDEDLRERTWEGLGFKYVHEAGDGGLVVDVIGTLAIHPVDFWGTDPVNTDQYTLFRQPRVYRGDPLLYDLFDPALEWVSNPEYQFDRLTAHRHVSDFDPTDVFISAYVESWNEEALSEPPEEREEHERNRVLGIYNGSLFDIDLGAGQYVLEIYGPPRDPQPVIPPPPVLVEHSITLGAAVTFELDKCDIRPQASATLDSLVEVLNGTDIFSELKIVGHTCDIATDAYNQRLSECRARSVRNYLKANGLNLDRVVIEGRGESEPAHPNTSEENRSRNRRSVFTFQTVPGREIQTEEVGEGENKRIIFSWVEPGVAPPPPPVVEVKEREIILTYKNKDFVEGDEDPREVIGLNGRIEPGETLLIAYDESDEVITDQAQIVTGQLDFTPSDTLVLRRFGGDRGLTCHAHSMAMLSNFEVEGLLFIDPDDPIGGPFCRDPLGCDEVDIASPN